MKSTSYNTIYTERVVLVRVPRIKIILDLRWGWLGVHEKNIRHPGIPYYSSFLTPAREKGRGGKNGGLPLPRPAPASGSLQYYNIKYCSMYCSIATPEPYNVP